MDVSSLVFAAYVQDEAAYVHDQLLLQLNAGTSQHVHYTNANCFTVAAVELQSYI